MPWSVRRGAPVLLAAALFTIPLRGTVPPTRALLILEGESVAEVVQAADRSGIGRAGTTTAAKARFAAIGAEQEAIEARLRADGILVTARLSRLINALAVVAAEDQLERLAGWPGVRSVQRERHYARALETSVPFLRVPAAWTPAGGGFTGAGVRVGVIDSGIDYMHADFGGGGDPNAYLLNDPTFIEGGSFPTAKVVGGYDFVGDGYDSTGNAGSTTAVPDPDPLDPALNGHGTHVAAIVAGFGVLTNGTAYPGPYDAEIEFGQFQVGPGVAPGALLYAWKVFGRQGRTASSHLLAALDRCADPDGDGDTGDRLDVVNLSVGSPFGEGGTPDATVAAVNRLVELGCVVCIAAGNNGNTHFVLGSPGVASRAVTVANSIDGGATYSTIRVDAPEAIAGDYTAVEGEFTTPLEQVGPITAPVVRADPPLACSALQNAAALAGKVALIDRGDCYFAEKVRLAMHAGAFGVIMVNNTDGPPIVMGGFADTSDIRIPAVMISIADGDLLKGQLANGIEVRVTLAAFAASARPDLADQLSDDSSRGPVWPGHILKPDLAAPGTSILAARAGGGSAGILFSGTSMAAPHVAGAAALLRQAHPDWPAENLKALLLNTAAPTHTSRGVALPQSRTGAGRLDLPRAAETRVIAKAETADGTVSLGFGTLELAQPYTETRTIRLVNHGSTDAHFQVVVSNTVPEAGVTLSPLDASASVPAGGSALVRVRFDADPAKFDRQGDPSTPNRVGQWPRPTLFEASGEVWFLNSTNSLHVPWYSAVRALSQAAATATRIGLPTSTISTLALPTRGPSAHRAPLVSAFTLGAASPNLYYPDARAAADLLAVGAASDAATAGSLASARVFFGLAVAGHWRTPQRAFLDLEVEVDLNGDGLADCVLMNGTGNGLNLGNLEDVNLMNDALVCVVRTGSSTSPSYVAGGAWNVLDPAFRDTAVFQNGVAVYAASATALGLSAGDSRFRYRAVTRGHANDATPWAVFDPAQPVVDATPFGLEQTPFFDEGRSVQVRVDRAQAAAAGFDASKPIEVLLLHQHNPAGQQIDIVRLDLGTDDTDADGWADAIELEQLGDLAGDGHGDRDGDRLCDADEVLAGTDPLDPDSVLALLPPVAPGLTLQWTSRPGRVYALERAASLTAVFAAVAVGIPATPPVNGHTDLTATGPGPYYYRIRLHAPP